MEFKQFYILIHIFVYFQPIFSSDENDRCKLFCSDVGALSEHAAESSCICEPKNKDAKSIMNDLVVSINEKPMCDTPTRPKREESVESVDDEAATKLKLLDKIKLQLKNLQSEGAKYNINRASEIGDKDLTKSKALQKVIERIETAKQQLANTSEPIVGQINPNLFKKYVEIEPPKPYFKLNPSSNLHKILPNSNYHPFYRNQEKDPLLAFKTRASDSQSKLNLLRDHVDHLISKVDGTPLFDSSLMRNAESQLNQIKTKFDSHKTNIPNLFPRLNNDLWGGVLGSSPNATKPDKSDNIDTTATNKNVEGAENNNPIVINKVEHNLNTKTNSATPASNKGSDVKDAAHSNKKEEEEAGEEEVNPESPHSQPQGIIVQPDMYMQDNEGDEEIIN